MGTLLTSGVSKSNLNTQPDRERPAEAEDSSTLRARPDGPPSRAVLTSPDLLFLWPRGSPQSKESGGQGDMPAQSSALPSTAHCGYLCAPLPPGVLLPRLDQSPLLACTHLGLRGDQAWLQDVVSPPACTQALQAQGGDGSRESRGVGMVGGDQGQSSLL